VTQTVNGSQTATDDWAPMRPRELLRSLGNSWLEVLKAPSLPQEIVAGLTVAAVALPLNIALAVACGLPPSAGLVAGAIGGAVAAVFGGSASQISGPATALSLTVFTLNQEFGMSGVAAACLCIGVIQLALCAVASRNLLKYIPESILTGFASGVGLKLLDNQIPELLGFDYTTSELAQMMHRPAWLHEVSWLAVMSGLFVAFLVNASNKFKRFPAALVAIALITAVANRLGWNVERVGLVPINLHLPTWPTVADDRWLRIITVSVPLAILAAVETLISAKLVKNWTSDSKNIDSNLEIFGQGVANLASGFVGGMPVSGVTIQSRVAVQSGARTRLSALFHSAALLFAFLYLNETISSIPLSALAGLLCMIGVQLIDTSTFFKLIRTQRVEALCFLLTIIGTLKGHLMVGLTAGIALHLVSMKVRRLIHSPASHEIAEKAKKKPTSGTRAKTLDATKAANNRRRINHFSDENPNIDWLKQIRMRAQSAASAFVHQNASVIGKVVLGDHVHIAAESSVRADEGSPFYIGSNSNVQDGVVLHALKDKWIDVDGEKWAIYVGQNVSIAHQALVHGPCYVGDNSFVGFQAVVHNSVVGSKCYIGIGAIVVGVNVPSGKYVPHGSIIDTQEAADQLPDVSHEHMHFNEEVVNVNRGLAAAYSREKSVSSKNLSKTQVNSRPHQAKNWF